MSKKKNILTGWVHRLEEGVLKSYGPGEVAPDWVDNPKVLATATDETKVENVNSDDTKSTSTGQAPDGADDLTDLDGKALRVIADELGVAKNGKLDDIRDRIRAKRAESGDQDDDGDRAALVEKARELGHEVDDSMSDTELQVLIEGA